MLVRSCNLPQGSSALNLSKSTLNSISSTILSQSTCLKPTLTSRLLCLRMNCRREWVLERVPLTRSHYLCKSQKDSYPGTVCPLLHQTISQKINWRHLFSPQVNLLCRKKSHLNKLKLNKSNQHSRAPSLNPLQRKNMKFIQIKQAKCWKSRSMKNYLASKWVQLPNRNQVTTEKSQSKVMILKMLTQMKISKMKLKRICLKITTCLIQMITIMEEEAPMASLRALEVSLLVNHSEWILVSTHSLSRIMITQNLSRESDQQAYNINAIHTQTCNDDYKVTC